jgi:Bacterial regulatory proteins, luxR family
MLLHSGPLGVMVQYLPFSFTTSTPFMVAFSRPCLPQWRMVLRLGISFHTAKFHVAAILAKLGADSRTKAVAKAAQLGLVML